MENTTSTQGQTSAATSSQLAGTTWNYTINWDNSPSTSGQFIFNSNGECTYQQSQPDPAEITMRYAEQYGVFTIIDGGGQNSAYGIFQGYIQVYPNPGTAQGTFTGYMPPMTPTNDDNATFTMTKA